MNIKLNLSCYTSIVLNTFKDVLCSKLYWHNRPGPTLKSSKIVSLKKTILQYQSWQCVFRLCTSLVCVSVDCIIKQNSGWLTFVILSNNNYIYVASNTVRMLVTVLLEIIELRLDHVHEKSWGRKVSLFHETLKYSYYQIENCLCETWHSKHKVFTHYFTDILQVLNLSPVGQLVIRVNTYDPLPTLVCMS